MSITNIIFSYVKYSSLNRFIVFLNQYLRHFLFISFLGIEDYGIWIFLMTIPSYLTLSDFGISDTAENHINLNLEKSSKSDLSKVFWSSISITVSIFILIFLLINFPFRNYILDYEKIISLTNNNNLFFINLIFFYSFIIIINKKFQSLILAKRGYNLLINLRSLSIIFEIIFVYLILKNDIGFEYLIFSFIGIRILIFLYTIHKFLSYKVISFNFSFLNFKHFSFLYYPSITFLLAPALNLIRLQGIVFLIINFLTPQLVTVYSVTSTIVRSTSIFIHLVSAPLNVEIAKLFSKHEINRVKKLINIQISFYFWLSLFVMPVFYFYGQEILLLWLKRDDLFVSEIFILLILSNSLFLISRPYNAFILSINLHMKYLLYCLVVSFILYIFFFVLLDNDLLVNPLYMVLLIDLFTYVIGIISIKYILKYSYHDLMESFSLIYLFKFINRRLLRKLPII